MKLPHRSAEVWASWWRNVERLEAAIKKTKGSFVGSTATRDLAKATVQAYFRELRPALEQLGIAETQIEELDWIMQSLLGLAVKRNRRATYQKRLRELTSFHVALETDIEIRGSRASGQLNPQVEKSETAILETLDVLIPSTSLSYRQVLQDLADVSRVSFRGTGAELREVVREILDHLAPDEQVIKAIKLDKDQKRPSMRQKASFILKARGVGDTNRKTAEDAVSIVEGSVASLARSVYDRGSLATHMATSRREILTFKGYTDAILAELLEIHR